ncbi:MAG TPA: glycosyltransferase [Chitinophagales bacterium]|nr:glycosyltransferase [Chitinophagales bacterium]HMZ93535.1 glycosyltransferase [Chitinophagales bacterium]HND45258.1 glycosyltransferase [Chitinophagales bacterium]HNK89044.1 glycosyltransferase [Chitinophagales bacterium]HNL15913.1 glycosyltransferase [Chitinophagales bacterium]
MQIKEINVFTNGDARKLSTWSNFPYFFTETLKEKGIKVNYVNIQPNKFLKNIYNFTIDKGLKKTKQHNAFDYYRTPINRFFANKIIQSAIKKFPNADANLFLNFSFSAKPYSNKPTILFGDWTYEHYFPHFKKRKPGRLEQTFIDAENQCIENADAVFVMFPKMAEIIKNRYNNKNIFYLGGYFINAKVEKNAETILAKKTNSNKILFIGTIKYKEGVLTLIEAVEILRQQNHHLEIHIIGMKKSDFSKLPDDVFCYGYLDKAKAKDLHIYNELMESAKMIVNTTPKWSGFSSVIEAMSFYNPIITIPYDDFIETFDKKINFGIYNQSPETLADDILNIIQDKNYATLCQNAHLAVKDFTWSNYIDRFLSKLAEI